MQARIGFQLRLVQPKSGNVQVRGYFREVGVPTRHQVQDPLPRLQEAAVEAADLCAAAGIEMLDEARLGVETAVGALVLALEPVQPEKGGRGIGGQGLQARAVEQFHHAPARSRFQVAATYDQPGSGSGQGVVGVYPDVVVMAVQQPHRPQVARPLGEAGTGKGKARIEAARNRRTPQANAAGRQFHRCQPARRDPWRRIEFHGPRRTRGLGGSHPAAIGEQCTVGQDQAFAVENAIDAASGAPGEFGFQGHGFLMSRVWRDHPLARTYFEARLGSTSSVRSGMWVKAMRMGASSWARKAPPK